jgi:protein subunit release factor B
MSTEPALIDAAVRAGWILASDDALVAQCEVDRYRASGPGGQHRNKTESAVRVRHRASGLSAIAEESRAQGENKARAIRRLREHLAIELRAPARLPISLYAGWPM